MSFTVPPSGGGYTCASCGGWVQYGVAHQCHTVRADPTWQLIQALYNVQRELARIADALEKGQA